MLGGERKRKKVRKKREREREKRRNKREEGRKLGKNKMWKMKQHRYCSKLIGFACVCFFSFTLIAMWVRRKSLRNYSSFLHVEYRIRYLLSNDSFVKCRRRECSRKRALAELVLQSISEDFRSSGVQAIQLWKMKD